MSLGNIGKNNNYTGYKIQRSEDVGRQIKDLRKHTQKVHKPDSDSVAKSLNNKQITPLPKREIPPNSSTNKDATNPLSPPSQNNANTLKIRALEDVTQATTKAVEKHTPSQKPTPLPSQAPKAQKKQTTAPEQDLSFVYASSVASSELSDTPIQRKINYSYLESFILIAAIVAHEGEFQPFHLQFDPELTGLEEIASQNSDYQPFHFGNPVETLIADYDKSIFENCAQIHRLDEENSQLLTEVLERLNRIHTLLDTYEQVKEKIQFFREVKTDHQSFKPLIIKELSPSNPPVFKDLPPVQPSKLTPLRELEITEKEKLDIEANFKKNFDSLAQKDIHDLVLDLEKGSLSITNNGKDDLLALAEAMGGLPVVTRIANNLMIRKKEAAQISLNKQTAQSNKKILLEYNDGLKIYQRKLTQQMDGARQIMQEASKYRAFPTQTEELLTLIEKLHSI